MVVSRFEADLAHTALFGWVCDQITPSALFDQPDFTTAVRFLIESERGQWLINKNRKLWPTDKWVMVDYRGSRIWINLADPFLGTGILNEDWEVAEVDFMVANLRHGDTMLDIGTNVGVYTLAAAKAVGSSGKVYGFEPMPKTFEMVTRSVAENGFTERCELHRTALGDQQGTISFHQSPSNPGSSHISPNGYDVPIARLDSFTFSGRITFLKVDIEGFEPHFFAGARNTITTHRPLILSEFFPRALREVGKSSPLEFITVMTAMGYECFLFEGSGLGRQVTAENIQEHERIETPENVIFRHSS